MNTFGPLPGRGGGGGGGGAAFSLPPGGGGGGGGGAFSIPPGNGGGGGGGGTFSIPPGGGGGGGGGAFNEPPGGGGGGGGGGGAFNEPPDGGGGGGGGGGAFSLPPGGGGGGGGGAFSIPPGGGGGGGGGAFSIPSCGWGGGGGGGAFSIPSCGWGGGGGGSFGTLLDGGGAPPRLSAGGATLPRASASAAAATFSPRVSRIVSSLVARANASAAPPSSANETDDADANDAPEASDDASSSESDASFEKTKSSTRATPSVPRGGKPPSPSTSVRGVSSGRARVSRVSRVSSSRVVDGGLASARSRRVAFVFQRASSSSTSSLSRAGGRIGLGGSLPLVGAPSPRASATGEDLSPRARPAGAPGGRGEALAARIEKVEKSSVLRVVWLARDEAIAGENSPDDADLPTRTAESRGEGFAASSSEPSETAQVSSRHRSTRGVVTTAIAVAVGVRGCASRCRARRDATSPEPPNRGVGGPRKREEGIFSRAPPLAASSSSASLSEVSRRFPPSEGVAPPRARRQLGAIARLLCTTGRVGGSVSARASRSAAERKGRRRAPRRKKGTRTT